MNHEGRNHEIHKTHEQKTVARECLSLQRPPALEPFQLFTFHSSLFTFPFVYFVCFVVQKRFVVEKRAA